jgi:hypothetical protein
MAFGAPADPIANVALVATFPARPVRTQRGIRTPLADDSTPGRDAWCETSDRRYRVDLRPHTRRSGFRGRLDSLAHSLPVSQRSRPNTAEPTFQNAGAHTAWKTLLRQVADAPVQILASDSNRPIR